MRWRGMRTFGRMLPVSAVRPSVQREVSLEMAGDGGEMAVGRVQQIVGFLGVVRRGTAVGKLAGIDVAIGPVRAGAIGGKGMGFNPVLVASYFRDQRVPLGMRETRDRV